MASFSSATRELVLKIVYYGPGLGGKTTTLKSLHAAVRQEHRGKMISLATPVDRTLYFDFLPVRLPSVGDLQLRLQLFTVPGQVYFNATRKLVLTGVDAVVFVADSQIARFDANVESLDNLRENLTEFGRSIDTTPIVIAYNKRDLGDTLSIDELEEKLNPSGYPALATSAAEGTGVFETLDAAVRLALDDLRTRGVIPRDIAGPDDGIVAERLRSVRADTPGSAEPVRIVSGDAKTVSAPLGAVLSPPGGIARDAAVATERSAERARARSTPTAPAPPMLAAKTPTMRPAGSIDDTLTPNNTLAAQVRPGGLAALAAVSPFPPLPPPPVAVARDGGGPAQKGSGVHSATTAEVGVSLAKLFAPEDQDTFRTIEEAIRTGMHVRALLLVESMLHRIFERVGANAGAGGVSPESMAWMLSIPPDRYLRLRLAAARARHGEEVSRTDALEAFVLVASAQIAAAPASR